MQDTYIHLHSTIRDKAASMKQEQKARRRKQAEVKKEIDALWNYYEEIKSALELKGTLKSGKSRNNTV